MRRRSWIGLFSADQRGAAAVITAVAATALITGAGVVVDMGNVLLKTRALQGAADLAALSAAGNLQDGNQQTAAMEAAQQSGVDSLAATVSTGTYSPDPTLTPDNRFQPGGSSPNAVKVVLTGETTLFFGGLLGRPTAKIGRSATAARVDYGAFSIGSTLVSLDGGVANAYLSALTGSKVSLSLVSYKALVSSQIDLLGFVPFLGAQVGLQGASYDKILAANIKPSATLNALADWLTQTGGDPVAAAAARALAQASKSQPGVALSSLIDLGVYQGQDHVAAGGVTVMAGAYDLAQAILALSNGSRQLAFQVDGGVPGVAAVNVWMATGERPNKSPWLTVNGAGDVIIRTAQTRIYLRADVGPGVASLLTGGALLSTSIYTEAASAQARLASVSCRPGGSGSGLSVVASPSLGALALAQVDPAKLNDFTHPETLTAEQIVATPLLKVNAYAAVDVGGGVTSWRTVSFTPADITGGTIKTVATNDVAQASLASLLQSATLTVQTPLGGLAIAPGAAGMLQGVLVGVAPALDAVLGSIETTAGVRLGTADIRAAGLRCGVPALVG